MRRLSFSCDTRKAPSAPGQACLSTATPQAAAFAATIRARVTLPRGGATLRLKVSGGSARVVLGGRIVLAASGGARVTTRIAVPAVPAGLKDLQLQFVRSPAAALLPRYSLALDWSVDGRRFQAIPVVTP